MHGRRIGGLELADSHNGHRGKQPSEEGKELVSADGERPAAPVAAHGVDNEPDTDERHGHGHKDIRVQLLPDDEGGKQRGEHGVGVAEDCAHAQAQLHHAAKYMRYTEAAPNAPLPISQGLLTGFSAMTRNRPSPPITTIPGDEADRRHDGGVDGPRERDQERHGGEHDAGGSHHEHSAGYRSLS